MSFTSIAISSGHGKYVSGASCYIDEVTEARRVTNKVAEYLKKMSVNVTVIHDDSSKTKAANITNGRNSYIVKKHNAASRQLDVSVHFNAASKTTSPRGAEVFYYDDKALAAKVSKAIANASGLKDRGAKDGKHLVFCKSTDKKALLLEICFVDSKADVDLYNKNFDKICRAIAETLAGKKIPAETTSSSTTKPSSTSATPIGVIEVITDSLNVRKKDDFDSAVVKTIKKGSIHKVYQKSNGMYKLADNQWCSAGTKYVSYTAIKKTYKVVKGDTLSKIASANKTTVAVIKKVNGLSSDTIQIGQQLLIP